MGVLHVMNGVKIVFIYFINTVHLKNMFMSVRLEFESITDAQF